MIERETAKQRLEVAGLPWPWRVACGGHEVPFHQNGKTYIYVFNVADKRHAYYCFDEDIFIDDKTFHDNRGF